MDAKEKNLLEEQARVEYEQRLAAIASVWEMTQKMGSTNGAILPGHKPARRQRPQGAGRGQLLKAVHKAVKEIEEPFTSEEVSQAIAILMPTLSIKRSSLKGALKKLVESKHLEVVVQGKGRRATEYKRIE